MQLFVRTDRTLSLQAEPSVTVLALKRQLRELSGVPEGEQRLVYAGKQLHDGATLLGCGLERDATLHLVLRCCGGKGGFGALLRAGARSTVSQNTDACRDLSGRRMRHVNADKKLQEWAADAKERELEKIALQHVRAEAKAAQRAARAEVDVDAVRAEQREGVARAQAVMSEVVAGGLPRGAKREAAPVPQEPAKRARLFADSVSDSESDSNDSDAEELPAPAAAAATAAAAAPAAPAAARSNGPAAARLGQDTSAAAAPGKADRQASVTSPKPAAPREASVASNGSEASAATVSAAGSPGQVASSADVPAAVAAAAPPAAAEPAVPAAAPAAAAEPAQKLPDLDWAAYPDAAAMEVLGMEQLKVRLAAAGLKAGGSLAERAARLFLLHDTPVSALDRKHLAKPAKKK